VPTAGEDATCPNCGGELDEEIDFCPWCTMRFETETPEDAAAE
jgi:predicted amidophosphoribosyltransferase